MGSTKITAVKTPTIRKAQPTRKRRRVTFSPFATCRNNALSDNVLSSEEIHRRWYSKEDEQLFKQDAITEMQAYRRKVHFNKDAVLSIPRGLERHTKERRMHKKNTIQLVLIAHRGGFHPEEVALLSREQSSWNTNLATTQASIDQIEVMIDGTC